MRSDRVVHHVRTPHAAIADPGTSRTQRTLVGRYWHDAFIQMDDFKNEGVVASSSWPFQVNLLEADKQPVASTVPEEGATGWADTTMMHVNAPHPNCARRTGTGRMRARRIRSRPRHVSEVTDHDSPPAPARRA